MFQIYSVMSTICRTNPWAWEISQKWAGFSVVNHERPYPQNSHFVRNKMA